ncbi:MAG: hypothetical protein QXJ96_03330 [Candidatus Aenigmatarchaeota archaeon]|nr:hypothetical protein [Candidatus Aenigmarchaeota archaeon]
MDAILPQVILELFTTFKVVHNAKLRGDKNNEKYSYKKMKGVQKDMINIIIGMVVFLLFILIIAALLKSLVKI